MKKAFIILTAVVMSLAFVNNVLSQEEEDRVEFSYGELISKSNDQVIISEFNFESDEVEEMDYQISEATGFDGINSLNDLQIGEEIDVLYEIEEGRRVATMVSRVTGEPDDFDDIEDEYQDEDQEDYQQEMEGEYPDDIEIDIEELQLKQEAE